MCCPSQTSIGTHQQINCPTTDISTDLLSSTTLGGSSGLLGCGSLPGLQFVESRLLHCRLGFLLVAGLTCLSLLCQCGGLHGGCGSGLDGQAVAWAMVMVMELLNGKVMVVKLSPDDLRRLNVSNDQFTRRDAIIRVLPSCLPQCRVESASCFYFKEGV